jgi:hypothetical protein
MQPALKSETLKTGVAETAAAAATTVAKNFILSSDLKEVGDDKLKKFFVVRIWEEIEENQ